MRILRVIHSTSPESGGPIESLTKRSEALLRDGHDVEVVSLDSPEEVSQRSFPFPLTALGRGAGHYGFNWRLPFWIRRNARRFDVVILHGMWNFSSIGAWLGLRTMSTPYFIFTHGMMDPWFRERYPFKHVVKQIYWWIAEGRVLRDAHRVLFTCEEEKLRARNVFRGFSYSECVVRYGTSDPFGDCKKEVQVFAGAVPALRNRRFLLFVGRIHPKKGCDLLIKAFARCQSELPEDVDLAIAGPDQVGWMRELKELARQHGVYDRIHWLGMVQGDQKWGAYRSAEALILPSHQENFGIVVAEAMACSTPVLISDKVNIWREVESAKAGMVEPDTLEGTCNLIRRFYSMSEDERNALRKSARKGFESRFDIDVATSEIVSVFRLEADVAEESPARKWNVLHVIHSTDPKSGGPIESAVQISEALIRSGHTAEVASLDDPRDLETRSFSFPVTPLGRGIGKYGYSWRLAPWLQQNARRFDIVILHGLWNYSSFGAWRALHGQQVPYVIFAHGMLDPWFNEQYPLKGLAKRLYWSLIEGRVLRDAKRVLFTCEEEKMRARLGYRGVRYKERVVLFGTADPEADCDEQKAALYHAMPTLRGRRYLLFIGRIHPKKGCDLLIRAFAECIGQMPEDVDLVIAGPDESGILPMLQEIALREGIAQRVHWSGMIEGDLKWGAFYAADALVLPSHQENFGIVIAEAMACGKPVLISNKVNIWREVQVSGAGLVEEDTLSGVRSLLKKFYALDKEKRDALGSAGRKLFLEKLEIESVTRDMLRLFYEVQES